MYLNCRLLNNNQPRKLEEVLTVARAQWKFPSLKFIDLTVISGDCR